jgi:hypothetical protein
MLGTGFDLPHRSAAVAPTTWGPLESDHGRCRARSTRTAGCATAYWAATQLQPRRERVAQSKMLPRSVAATA